MMGLVRIIVNIENLDPFPEAGLLLSVVKWEKQWSWYKEDYISRIFGCSVEQYFWFISWIVGSGQAWKTARDEWSVFVCKMIYTQKHFAENS